MRTYHAKLFTALIAVATLSACDSGSAVSDGIIADSAKPRVTLIKGNTTTDTIIPVSISARDNIGIKNIHVTLQGGVVATFDDHAGHGDDVIDAMLDALIAPLPQRTMTDRAPAPA